MRTAPTRKLRTKLSALTGVAALTLAAACGNGDEAEDGDRGSITIGIANEQPFGYTDAEGNPTGFAPDVATAVLEGLGYTEVNAEVVEFGQLIGGLQARQFDLIAAGMYITEERLGQILFSDPDYCIEESLAVEEGNPHDIVDYTSFVDNTDITIAVASGTVEEGYAEDAGIADDQIRTYAGIDQMYAALAAGEIDAVTGTNATVQGQVRAREGIEAVDPFFPVTEEGEEILPCGGYGFRLDDQEFRDEFNAQLNQLREDGTTWELISPYQDQDGPSEEDVEQANQLTVEDFQE
jgi:polar amino acid transport system substrate-binding protein